MVDRKLLPVGAAYLAHVRRSLHKLSFEEHDIQEEERDRLRGLNGSNEIVDDLGVGDEEEGEDLKFLDSKEWKASLSLTIIFPSVFLQSVPETRPLCCSRFISSTLSSNPRSDQNRP